MNGRTKYNIIFETDLFWILSLLLMEKLIGPQAAVICRSGFIILN